MDNGASSYHRFLEGDRDGFAQIVYDYYDGLVLYLNMWLNNLHDAEDMGLGGMLRSPISEKTIGLLRPRRKT